MGGILIVLVLDLAALLWTQWNALILLTLLSLIVLAGLGFYDDYMKITQQNNRGTASQVKLWVQFALALFIGIYLWMLPETKKLISEVMVPFFKHPVLTGAGPAGLVLTVLTIMGSSNAVNFTDGLDGLAIGCTLIVAAVFLVFTYIAGNFRFAEYLQVPYVNGAGELTIFCAAMIGAGLGFLWFNCHPAQMFMGDTGSLALGGVLGIIAVLIHQPLVLVIASADTPQLRLETEALRTSGVDVRLGVKELPSDAADFAVVSPGVPSRSALVQGLVRRNIPVIGELELGYQQSLCLNISIAGT